MEFEKLGNGEQDKINLIILYIKVSEIENLYFVLGGVELDKIFC